jgi:hypothetical protein
MLVAHDSNKLMLTVTEIGVFGDLNYFSRHESLPFISEGLPVSRLVESLVIG